MKPEIQSYIQYGAFFSVVEEDIWPWVYNNFIQIRYASLWTLLCYDIHRSLLSNCPALSYYEFPKVLWNDSIINIIINCIDSGYYLFLWYDYYYISKALMRFREHKNHEVFIYGYDMEESVFYMADNIDYGRFLKFTCSFKEFEESYLSFQEDYLKDIRFIKRRKEFECGIDIEQIIINLENYLYSKRTIDLWYEQKCVFGLKAVELICNGMQEKNDRKHMDIRAFHLLYEHKVIMERRVQYLYSKGYLKDNVKLVNDSVLIKDKYLQLRNIALKFMIAQDNTILENAADKLQKNIVLEKEFIGSLISALS